MTERYLCVDANWDRLEQVRDRLRALRIDCHVATELGAAIRRLRSGGAYDAVLLGEVPGISDGRAAGRILRAISPSASTPVVHLEEGGVSRSLEELLDTVRRGRETPSKA